MACNEFTQTCTNDGASAHRSRRLLNVERAAPAVLLLHELVQAGIRKERLVVALCRILSDAEQEMARAYIVQAGYDVLPGGPTTLPRE